MLSVKKKNTPQKSVSAQPLPALPQTSLHAVLQSPHRKTAPGTCYENVLILFHLSLLPSLPPLFHPGRQAFAWQLKKYRYNLPSLLDSSEALFQYQTVLFRGILQDVSLPVHTPHLCVSWHGSIPVHRYAKPLLKASQFHEDRHRPPVLNTRFPFPQKTFPESEAVWSHFLSYVF